ncbi:MAG: hypothetical protein RR415_06765, partial [Ruthenibacterium sp.]
RVASNLPDNCSLQDVNTRNLCDLSKNILLAENALREVFEQIEPDTEKYEALLCSNIANFCTVTVPEHSIIRITFANAIAVNREYEYRTSGKTKSGSNAPVFKQFAYNHTKLALEAYLSKNERPKIPKGLSYLIFKRYVPSAKDTYSLQFCDNNNMELSGVTNAISRVLPKSDNCYNMAFIYLTQASKNIEKPTIEATLIDASELLNWADYLSF